MSEGEVVEFPDVLELFEKDQVPEEIYAPDGTLLFKPYAPPGASPLIANRQRWRLFANYVPVENRPQEWTWIVKVNTTGQTVIIRDYDVIVAMLGYIRRVNPGATVAEAVAYAVDLVEKYRGGFKDDKELMAFIFSAYLIIAYLIAYEVLILVKD